MHTGKRLTVLKLMQAGVIWWWKDRCFFCSIRAVRESSDSGQFWGWIGILNYNAADVVRDSFVALRRGVFGLVTWYRHSLRSTHFNDNTCTTNNLPFITSSTSEILIQALRIRLIAAVKVTVILGVYFEGNLPHSVSENLELLSNEIYNLFLFKKILRK